MTTSDPIAPCRTPALRVLVVDDNVDGAQAMCAVLATMGCTTAAAFNGVQGLAMVQTFDPHLALIDLEMPDMSGCDLVRQLKAGPLKAGQTRNAARLVCLTGRGLQEDRRLCADAGFDDFFSKPMLPESLAEVLAAANAETWSS